MRWFCAQVRARNHGVATSLLGAWPSSPRQKWLLRSLISDYLRVVFSFVVVFFLLCFVILPPRVVLILFLKLIEHTRVSLENELGLKKKYQQKRNYYEKHRKYTSTWLLPRAGERERLLFVDTLQRHDDAPSRFSLFRLLTILLDNYTAVNFFFRSVFFYFFLFDVKSFVFSSSSIHSVYAFTARNYSFIKARRVMFM